MTLNSCFVQVHHICKVNDLCSHSLSQGRENVRVPSGSMSRPAAPAVFVQEEEILLSCRWNQLQMIFSISERDVYNMIVIPHHIHCHVNILPMSLKHRMIAAFLLKSKFSPMLFQNLSCLFENRGNIWMASVALNLMHWSIQEVLLFLLDVEFTVIFKECLCSPT